MHFKYSILHGSRKVHDSSELLRNVKVHAIIDLKLNHIGIRSLLPELSWMWDYKSS